MYLTDSTEQFHAGGQLTFVVSVPGGGSAQLEVKKNETQGFKPCKEALYTADDVIQVELTQCYFRWVFSGGATVAY